MSQKTVRRWFDLMAQSLGVVFMLLTINLLIYSGMWRTEAFWSTVILLGELFILAVPYQWLRLYFGYKICPE